MDKLYTSFVKKIKTKKMFIIKVFAMLIFQIVLCFLSLRGFEQNPIIHKKGYLIGAIILLFVIVIFINYIKNVFLKFITFCLFSVTTGFILSYQFFTRVEQKKLGEEEKDYENRLKQYAELENKALLTTISIFVFMVLFGLGITFFNINIPPAFGIGLFFALFFMIIFIFIASLSHVYSMFYKFISAAIIVIFSLYILYDTYNILGKEYNGDYVSASLDYFLDFINIFSSTLNLS
jgi:FtsH-binding integral membrane protein